MPQYLCVKSPRQNTTWSSQWPRVLRHEPSSLPRTLGSYKTRSLIPFLNQMSLSYCFKIQLTAILSYNVPSSELSLSISFPKLCNHLCALHSSPLLSLPLPPLISHAFFMPHNCHSPWFDRINNIWERNTNDDAPSYVIFSNPLHKAKPYFSRFSCLIKIWNASSFSSSLRFGPSSLFRFRIISETVIILNIW